MASKWNQPKRQYICVICGRVGGASIPEPFGTDMIPLRVPETGH